MAERLCDHRPGSAAAVAVKARVGVEERVAVRVRARVVAGEEEVDEADSPWRERVDVAEAAVATDDVAAASSFDLRRSSSSLLPHTLYHP